MTFVLLLNPVLEGLDLMALILLVLGASLDQYPKLLVPDDESALDWLDDVILAG